jgi:hypothetical protein
LNDYPLGKSNSDITSFAENLLLPPVGRRASNGELGNTNALSYWSSSPDADSTDSPQNLARGFYYSNTDGLQLTQKD